MKRRDMLAGMAGFLVAGVAAGVVRPDSPLRINASGAQKNLWQRSRVATIDDPKRSLWLGYPSDPSDAWLSVGVLTDVRHKLVATGTSGKRSVIVE